MPQKSNDLNVINIDNQEMRRLDEIALREEFERIRVLREQIMESPLVAGVNVVLWREVQEIETIYGVPV